ncbi:U3 small nucleolar ribonucleoprotein protein MPP10 isoform X2 [Pistacia vera]|uniref:U3 small nucleolar ribonucleoprotein protein MPP10 isoform X2 n=1 Tax=Pistacia vera TaxID=55513 RepID=UPI0012631B47|nr:U3 small nucleolar ribonucleoprotein protein MPP10 isoform X2 [Pistacia vera]
MEMATSSEASLDLEALRRLKSTEPPLWLAPSAELSDTARSASEKLFSFLKTYAPKSPLDQLLVNGFDAEQIWQQIDLQSQPLLSSLKREVKKFEKNPGEIGEIKKVLEGDKKGLGVERKGLEEESDGFDEELDDGFDDDDDDDDDDREEEEEEEEKEVKGEEEEEEEDEDEDEGSESEEEEMEEEEKGKGGIEDDFLKINELQEYLEEDEAREYGIKKDSDNKKKKGGRKVLDEDEDDDDEEDEEDEEELGLFDDEEDEKADELENARYEDFFGGKRKKVPQKKSTTIDESEEDSDLDDEQDDDKAMENQKNDNLSTHEKQLKKLQSEIEKMEKANLDPKTWTMQGEVTAAQRPKNSALEVDLDFQHNVRPAPVITEEFTASLEEIIKKRILEGQFDDVQKAPSLPTKAPRELKELDENKSKKGLAEIYEEEYVQKTNPAAAPLSFSDEQKKEASMLFKKLCLKLDALSHFHFTPKPVIDDMSIQANVPALAMEEIAPIAVSDAAMLAPEEVFAGKGDVKEEAELTQAERKRRRANKKRKYKAEAAKRTMAKKARENTSQNHNDGNEE